MRRVPALLIAAGLLIATLSGCSSAADANCIVHPGTASKLVSATGAFAKKQKVSFPTPLNSGELQRSTLIQGTGQPLQLGQPYKAMLSLGEGSSGQTSPASHGLFVVSQSQLPGLSKSLQCVAVGSRVAVTGPAAKIFGASEAQQIGFSSGASAVVVTDVTKSYLARANGEPQPSRSGFPTVVLAPNGQPGIKVPTTPAPKTVKTETLKSGGGTAVKKGDTILANYTQVAWSDNTVTDSSWQQGAPVQWSIGGSSSSSSTQGGPTPAPAGTENALIGAKVGSQIVVLTPAEKSSGSAASAYVIDVLGIL